MTYENMLMEADEVREGLARDIALTVYDGEKNIEREFALCERCEHWDIALCSFRAIDLLRDWEFNFRSEAGLAFLKYLLDRCYEPDEYGYDDEEVGALGIFVAGVGVPFDEIHAHNTDEK